MSAPPFASQQRGVATGMAAAAGVTIVAAIVALRWGGGLLPAMPTTADRLAFALRCDIPVVATLLFAIAAVAARRFFSAADVDGAAFAPATPPVAIGRALLANTHEQVTLAVFAHLALASVVREREIALVPVFAALFCLGRGCFALGYARGAARRAFGFGFTFYPTIVALALAARRLLR
ncbi:MAPEG family protein [Sphingomonas sp. TZW2008]|uniref:MAPEG family protein n=1 Tax=Sphingomonas sp. TZW2008 TaxID=1917973 RepID=UPI00211A17A1|nr:MAPEG family protein [Sphingomonas sp. TZW2008]